MTNNIKPTIQNKTIPIIIFNISLVVFSVLDTLSIIILLISLSNNSSILTLNNLDICFN